MTKCCNFKLKQDAKPARPSNERDEKYEPSSHAAILRKTQKPSIELVTVDLRDPQALRNVVWREAKAFA
jgi:hypothetical protein